MALISITETQGINLEEVQRRFISDHDFFYGKKILSMKYHDLNWYVTVEDNRKKSGTSLYIVHLNDIMTRRITPLNTEILYYVRWILKRKKDGYRYSWSINGQPMKNTEQVFYTDDETALSMARRQRVMM